MEADLHGEASAADRNLTYFTAPTPRLYRRRFVGLAGSALPSVSSSRRSCCSVELVVQSISSFRRSRSSFGRSRRSIVLVVLTVPTLRLPCRSVCIAVPSISSFRRSRRSVGLVAPSVSSSRRFRLFVGLGHVCACSQHSQMSSSLHGLTAEAEHAQGMMHFPKASKVNCAGAVFFVGGLYNAGRARRRLCLFTSKSVYT